MAETDVEVITLDRLNKVVVSDILAYGVACDLIRIGRMAL